MRTSLTSQRAVPHLPYRDWRYWLLPAGILLVTLLQALPAQSAAEQVQSAGMAERVLPAEPGVPASHAALRQVRRDGSGGSDDGANTPLDFLLVTVLPLASVPSCVFQALHFYCPSPLSVVSRPGAPRGPPAGL